MNANEIHAPDPRKAQGREAEPREFSLGQRVRVRVPNLEDEPRYERRQVVGYCLRNGRTAYYWLGGLERPVPADRLSEVELCEGCGDAADQRCRCYFN